MTPAKSVRIDPIQIANAARSRPAKASITGSAFGDFMGIAGALAPLAGEMTYQATGSPNAASVLHAAFSALPGSFAPGGGYPKSALGGDMPGYYGAPSYGTGISPYGSSAGGVPGLEGVNQAQLIDQMNTNNLQLLELQAVMQNNMQQWTTKGNILKSVHDAKMALIQHFAVRG